MRRTARPVRPAVALAAFAGCLVTLAACATRPDHTTDPAARTALRFCQLYFEAADPEAALAVTAGEAASQMRAQAAARAGLPVPQQPRASVALSRRDSYEGGALLKYRVDVLAWPLAGDARGTPSDLVPFDLFLRREAQAPGGWRVVSALDGR